MREIDNFYLSKEEPNKSCLIALKTIIMNYSVEFTPGWKYKLPCFLHQKKIFCYLWIDKETGHPYISVNKGVHLNHPALYVGDRKNFALLFIDPNEDIPVDTIYEIFDLAMGLYKT